MKFWTIFSYFWLIFLILYSFINESTNHWRSFKWCNKEGGSKFGGNILKKWYRNSTYVSFCGIFWQNFIFCSNKTSVSRLTRISNDQYHCSSDDLTNYIPLKCKQIGLRSCLISEKSQKASKTKSRKKDEPNKLSYLDIR
jgi:hypothetical protein